MTASLAMRNTFLRRPRKPLARASTFLWRARAVTPRLTRGMELSPSEVVEARADQRPANGSICAMWPMFVLSTVTAPRRWRLFFVDFFVRMWRLNAWPRLTVPPGRTRNRFAALFFVFILGMIAPSSIAAAGAAGISRRLASLQSLVRPRTRARPIALVFPYFLFG